MCLEPCAGALKQASCDVAVYESPWEKVWLLPLTARAVPAWRLLPHQRRAKLPERKGSAGGRVLSQASQGRANTIVNHQSEFISTDGFQPTACFGFRSKLSLSSRVSFLLNRLNLGGFSVQMLRGSSRLANQDFGCRFPPAKNQCDVCGVRELVSLAQRDSSK